MQGCGNKCVKLSLKSKNHKGESKAKKERMSLQERNIDQDSSKIIKEDKAKKHSKNSDKRRAY